MTRPFGLWVLAHLTPWPPRPQGGGETGAATRTTPEWGRGGGGHAPPAGPWG